MDNQDAVEVTCTDNGKKVTGYILNYRAKDQLDAADDLVGIDPGAFDIFITVN
jgi:hypothetical protein